MANRRKRSPSVKNRIAKAQGSTATANGGQNGGKSSQKSEGVPTVELVKIPATQADWLAAQLHESRGDIIDLKNALLAKDNILLEKDKEILSLKQIIHTLERKLADVRHSALEAKNDELRKEFGFELGRRIEKDDESGDVFWFQEAPQDSGN